MGVLELIILFVGITLYGILVFSNFKYLAAIKVITIILTVILIVQAVIEKPRWVFAVFYITNILLILLFLVFRIKNIRHMSITFRIILKISYGVLIVGTVLLLYYFPTPKITKPEGNYAIGTNTFDIVDETREAVYDNKEGKNRRFKVQVWYPAQNIGNLKTSPWLLDGKPDVIGLSKLSRIPNFVLSQLEYAKSNSYFDADISEKENKYPVIIMSHGWTSSRFMHTNMAESLASNGYIVLGIEHTYGSLATVFDNGDVAYFNNKTLPKIDSKDFLKSANILVKTFNGDIEYVLNHLDDYNKGIKGPRVLKGKLDIDDIGLLGHSTGGGAAVLTGIKDSRIKGILGYDAWVQPIDDKYIKSSLKIPSLFFRSEEWEKGVNNNNLLPIVRNNKDYSKLYEIHGAKHSDFTLMYLISPLIKKINALGKIDGDTLSKFQGKIDVAFFDYSLKGKSEDGITKVLSQYSQVKFIDESRR